MYDTKLILKAITNLEKLTNLIEERIKSRSARATREVKKKRVMQRISLRLDKVVEKLEFIIGSHPHISFDIKRKRNKARLSFVILYRFEKNHTKSKTLYPVSKVKGRSPSKPGRFLTIVFELEKFTRYTKMIKKENVK